MYVRGSMAVSNWGTAEACKLVLNEENDSLEITLEFAVGDKFKVADTGWGKQYGWGQFVDQTNGALAGAGQDIEVLLAATYNIVISSASDSSLSVCTISLDSSSVDPENPEPTVIPLPDMYVRGSHSGWNAEEEFKLVYNDETKEASLELHLDVETKFKVADNTTNWTVQFDYSHITLPADCFINSNGDIIVAKGGIYKVVITDANDKTKAACTITLVEEDTEVVLIPLPDMYVRGSMTGEEWPALEDYKLVLNAEEDTLEITLDFAQNDLFKVADANWGKEFAWSAIIDETNGGLADDWGNIKVVVAGTYKIVVSSASDKTKSTCTVTLVEAVTPEQPEEPEQGDAGGLGTC